MWPLYGTRNDAETFFTAFAQPASKLPPVVVTRAGIFPAESAARKLFHRFAWPGRIGDSAHLILSCAAACTTSYSTGPTTPTKSPWRTTLTFLRCEIELSSTDSGFEKPSVIHGPWPRRTQRPCCMPGTLIVWL